MTESAFFDALVVAWFVLAAATFPVLLFVAAPYGRHIRRGWGPLIPDKLGWMIMEAPAVLVFATCYVLGAQTAKAVSLAFLGLWEVHYAYRAFIYPLGLRGGRRMPVSVVGIAFTFNVVNGYLNGRYLFTFANNYPTTWLVGPQFLVGTGLFVVGCLVNRQADRVLRRLRQLGESGYRVPYGGLYRWISCPNYLGEIIEWLGWAIATWSLPGLAFALWTAANLVPRARAHHRWYLAHLPGYPSERKALVPGLW